jgi:hypothetical protein
VSLLLHLLKARPTGRTCSFSAWRGLPPRVPCQGDRVAAIEQVDRAKIAHEDAAHLLDDSRRARAERRRLRSATEACPLCAHPATIVDWRPSVDWIVVEDCPCDGFFIRASLLAAHLPTLPEEERQELARRVREFRVAGLEAWCTTSDGGRALRVSSVRPDRPT